MASFRQICLSQFLVPTKTVTWSWAGNCLFLLWCYWYFEQIAIRLSSPRLGNLDTRSTHTMDLKEPERLGRLCVCVFVFVHPLIQQSIMFALIIIYFSSLIVHEIDITISYAPIYKIIKSVLNTLLWIHWMNLLQISTFYKHSFRSFLWNHLHRIQKGAHSIMHTTRIPWKMTRAEMNMLFYACGYFKTDLQLIQHYSILRLLFVENLEQF